MKLPGEMKDLAHVIIEGMPGTFDASEFNDRYEDAVVELIRSKQEGLLRERQSNHVRPMS